MIHYSAAPVVGGVERVTDEHGRLFASKGHDVTVLCLRGGDARAVLLPGDPSPEAQAAVLRPVLQEQDVVFVHNVMTMPFHPGLTGALWALADELPGVRFIAWLHDIAACNPDYPDVPGLMRKAHPRFEYVAVSALRAREFLSVTGESPDRCRVIPNGLDPARVLGLPQSVADFAREHRLFDGRIVLLHPTRLVRRKRIEMSLAVARELIARGQPAVALVTAAADPHRDDSRNYLDELRGQAGAEGGQVWVGDHFPIGHAELAGLYQLADALIFPSSREGFGLPVIEALLHRLPVFCSDIEPLRDLPADNVTRFPVDANPAQIATVIAARLDASSAFRARKRTLGEFGWESVYERHLEPLLAGR